MLVWKQILWLRDRIKQQKEWIARCGGDLAGYTNRYGDFYILHGKTGYIPPLADGRNPKATSHLSFKTTRFVPDDKRNLFTSYKQTELTGYYFVTPFGDGATAIYKADTDRLNAWERELLNLESNHYAAYQKANEQQAADNNPYPPEED